jgi:hypothetical protein
MLRWAGVPAVLLLGCGIAMAQTASPPQPGAANPEKSSETPCAPGTGAATTGSGQSGSNLSDKLAQSNGVICPPPAVDPQMRVPAPQGGRMKVIPPPGTPGGDQNTVPK